MCGAVQELRLDVLIIEPLEAEVTQWLAGRHSVVQAPELAGDPPAFQQAMEEVRAVVLPPHLALTERTLARALRLRAIGRVSGGAENVDLEACARRGIEIVRSYNATARAEAEFMIGALLSLLRRVPVESAGMRAGRELGACTVGLIGMAPAAKSIVTMLSGFGSRVVGYEPTWHANDAAWDRWRVAPVGLRELLETSDAVCVQLSYFSRYKGLLGERLLRHCKPNQVIVSATHSGVFDEQALADALKSGRVAAAWLDCLEPGALDQSRPLGSTDSLQITPRLASTTRESRLRSAWSVVKRIDELLCADPADEPGVISVPPGVSADRAAETELP